GWFGRTLYAHRSRGYNEPLSVPRARGSRAGVKVLGPEAERLPRQAFSRAPRSVRPGRLDAADARRRAGGRPGRGLRPGGAARRERPCGAAARPTLSGYRGRGAADASRGAVAAVGTGARTGRPCVAHDRGACRSRAGAAGARRRGALVPPPRGARVSLALAAFAAETGQHLVAEPRSARFAAFRRGLHEAAYPARLAAGGFRFLERLPPLLTAIHDPPTGP